MDAFPPPPAGYGHPPRATPPKPPFTSLSSSTSTVRRKKQSAAPASPQSSPPPPLDSAGASSSTGANIDYSKVRAYAACKNCRIKKIKCLPDPIASSSSVQEGGQPGTCQQCAQAGVECVYPPTRDRAAYSRQYVQNLEGRVQALETLNARMMPLLEMWEREHGSVPMGNGDGDMRLKEGDEEEEEAPGHQQQHGQHQHPPMVGDEMDEDAGQVTHDERGNLRWIGESNTLSLLDSFSHRSPSEPHLVPRPTSAHDTSHYSHHHHHHHHHHQPHHTSAHHPPHHLTPTDEAPRMPPPVHRDSNPYFSEVAGSGVVKALPAVEEVVYPSPEAAEEMIDAFFKEVHPCLPVVLEYEFREGVQRLMDNRRKGIPTVGGFVSVLFAVFALGERVIVTSRAWQREKAKLANQDANTSRETVLEGEAEAGVIWYERAQILHYSTLKDVDIHQVQCLTLLAAFQASVNAMPISWLLAGQALRVAQDLGLHRSMIRLRLPFAEKQLGARCWWAIYGLERLVSISLGRPLGIDDLDVDVSYPAEIDDAAIQRVTLEGIDSPKTDALKEPPEGVMSGFVALTKLCKIAGRVAHLLYRPSNGRSTADPSWAISQQNTINKFDKMLRDWLEKEVPSKYKDPSMLRPVQLLSAVLSNSYFSILITLHRNFLPPNPSYPRPKPPPNSQSLSHCVDAARSVIHIAAQQRTLLPPTHHLAVFCQYLWSSAVILLLCEVQAKDQVVVDAVEPSVENCRRSLQALEPVWPGCRKLKELLGDVEGRAREVRMQHAAAGSARKEAERTGSAKKRKGADGVKASKAGMAPPAPGMSRSASSGSGQNDAVKRQRIIDNRYETSDTRTPSEPIPTPPILGPHTMQQQQQQQQRQAQSYPSHLSQPSLYDPQNLPFDYASMNDLQQPQPILQQTFDLGGVTFDGLEMLQGFTAADSNAFWNTLTAEYINPSPSAQGLGYNMGSGQTTPSGSAHGSNMSPGQGGGGWQNFGMADGGAHAGGVGAGPGAGQEFWNQVQGASFDWQADPSVPFNI